MRGRGKVLHAPMLPKLKYMNTETQRRLPQLLECDGDYVSRAIHLLELGRALKTQIGEKADERKGTPGSGLLGRLGDIEDALRLIQVENNLQGLRHNDIVFSATAKDGREKLDRKKLMDELYDRGVSAEVINEAFDAAIAEGHHYWQKEWIRRD